MLMESGISPLGWFESYLKHHTQYIKLALGDAESS